MTLEEAFYKQKKELLSLRAAVKRYEKQPSDVCVLFTEQKESYEKKIRGLERQLQTEQRRNQDLFSQLKIERNINWDTSLELLDLQEKYASIKTDYDELLDKYNSAQEEISKLNGSNAELFRKQHANFENSSLPSSALPFRKKVPNSRKPTGRKPGAQPGHSPASVSRLQTTVPSIFIPAPDSWNNDGDLYRTGKDICRQFIDIKLNVIVRDYIAPEFRKRSSGSRIHPPFPEGICGSVNYGPGLKAFAFLLTDYYNVSIEKAKQCIHDLTGGIINLSSGMICRLSKEFSEKSAAERDQIFSRLSHADVLYSDATVSNINGSRKAVVLCTDESDVLYQHSDHKGLEALNNSPIADFNGTIVHDHDISYYRFGSSHQECLAHVLRYLIGAKELEPDLTWHSAMHDHLDYMIHRVKSEKLTFKEKRGLKEKYLSIIQTAEQEYIDHPPSKYFPDGFNLYTRMKKFSENHLYFLDHPEVNYTNNFSERELRKFKRKQKQAVAFRSDDGCRFICDALTIIETARLHNQNIYDKAKSIFST